MQITAIFSDFWNSILVLLPNILSGIITLIVFTLLGWIIKRITINRLRRKWEDTLVAEFIGGILKWIFISIGLILGLHFVGLGGVAISLMAGAGISALILGFAFKDIAENFLAGFLLAINRPFKKGDLIELNGFKGPVRKIDPRVTHVRTADGRDIYIPNSMIVSNVLINYTKDGLIRQEFVVGLDTFDNLAEARECVLEYFEKQPDILKQPIPNFIVEEIAESSIQIKILFWIDMFKVATSNSYENTREIIRSRVVREIKDLLLANGFNLPSVIIEHKMYSTDSPLKIQLDDNERT
jgi:small conductance mechanosensitive channel